MRTRMFSAGILLLVLLVSNATPDGKLLRGEKWTKFDYSAKTADFYVAANGDDDWSGKLAEPNAKKTDGPFASIRRAQEAVRQLKNQVYTPKNDPIEKRYIGSNNVFGAGKDILVYIREGYYSLEEPLVFKPEDGGERVETDLPSGAFEYHKLKDHYVTYAAYPDEKPVISGARRITGWQKNGDRWKAAKIGFNVEKLLVNGILKPLARIPNEGYLTPAEIPHSKTAFKFRAGDLRAWDNMENNRIIMLLRWHTGINSIKAIDEKNNLAVLEKPQDGIIVVPPRYYIENVKDLLDAPGEWFFDKDAEELFLIPPHGITDPNAAHVAAPGFSRILTVQGSREAPVRNLRFYGLRFEGSKSGDRAIDFSYAHNCELMDSRINGLGGIGVYLGLGSYQNKICGNTLENIENSGILVVGSPHPEHWMDIIRENDITHNYLSDCGGQSIAANNCLNTTISYNEVTQNTGRTAIYVGGWANLEEAIDGGYRVEYNHIHHVQGRADDSGAITTAGLTHDSVLRGNLIHDVKAGYFNNNVAIWFDNMSLGWTAEDNIYYNLEQDEMKLCACNLVDNIYQNNYHLEAPAIAPEGIIQGHPAFTFSNIQVVNAVTASEDNFYTGDYLHIIAEITNNGASGIADVDLYIDGKVVRTQPFPVIKGNKRTITFDTRFSEPGLHQVAVGSSAYREIMVSGEKPSVLYDALTVSGTILPQGETLIIEALVKNMLNTTHAIDAGVYLNNEMHAKKSLKLAAGASEKVRFEIIPPAGLYNIRVGNTPTQSVEIYPHRKLDISTIALNNFCSATANPCEFGIDQKANRFTLTAAGTDFLHGEDSYGVVYLDKPVRGNFVATVMIRQFGDRTNEWFRAGIFARNDMTKSFDTGEGSLGSVLVFSSPSRAGMNWDEFGNGCMHKASSENLRQLSTYPIWLKLVRHGNRFSGYISQDGKTWYISRHTNDIPGLGEAIHLGLAAGSPDEIQYTVEFVDLQVDVENE